MLNRHQIILLENCMYDLDGLPSRSEGSLSAKDAHGPFVQLTPLERGTRRFDPRQVYLGWLSLLKCRVSAFENVRT